MKKIVFSFLFLFTFGIIQGQNKWNYYFDQPASIWEESIPLGNGRIGMMPWGGIERERVVLNEISMWSGNKQDADNPEANKHLGEIRNLLFQKKNKEAQELMYRTFTCKGEGSAGVAYGKYQTFGNLYVDFIYPDAEPQSAYKRNLDMNNAISTVSYQKGDVNYQREYFTSFADDMGIIRYTANKKESLNIDVSFERAENYETRVEGSTIIVSGQLDAAKDAVGMQYAAQIKVINKNGSIVSTPKGIRVKNADEITILVAMATNYKDADPAQLVKKQVENTALNYAKLKTEHSLKYKKLFDRLDLTLDKNRNSHLPIDKRLEAFATDKTDYDLAALYLQYGRYLLISSTRQGGLPPNLQGLWAPQINTPWNGDYHLNINLQMNMWGAEMFNLSELHLPMINYTKSLVESGEKTAKIYYNSRGWVTHILGNVWQFTSPSEDPSWGATNTAGAWLCQHLWEHYVYTQDKEYLASVYPTMKGAALFFDDMLVEDPTNHYLVTAPTTSPENSYITDQGSKLAICAGSTMDNQLVSELFTNTARAAQIVGVDTEWAKSILAKKEKLKPTTIGKHGQIMEWMEDYDEAEIHHRHVSQLYGLHPSNQLTYSATPELMEAAKTTLNRRGDQSTGWSMAWKINFWARLKDGDRAYKLIGDLFKPAKDSWGTYPNLFSAHPPMQIDGNFGGSAGIGEMLVQSHEGHIELLPAIPVEWKNGELKGFKVRGGGEISLKWSNGQIRSIELRAIATNKFEMKISTENIKIRGTKNYKIANNRLTVNLTKGQVLNIEM